MDTLNKEIIGGRIKSVCIKLNGNVKSFSIQTDTPYQTLMNYCKGRSYPKADFMNKLFCLGVSIDWLLSGSGRMMRAESPVMDKKTLEIKEQQTIYRNRTERINTFIIDFMKSHGPDERAWLEMQIERAIPEFKMWKSKL